VLSIVIVCSAAELGFEQHAHGSTIHNFGDALWWATVTVTTVGYGDKYPVSPGGRGLAVVLMLVGIGLISVLTATAASYFVEEKADQQKAKLNQRLDRIEAMLARALAPPDKTGPDIAPDGKDLDPQRPADYGHSHIRKSRPSSQ
jgi:voltage-gated potassium channel